MRAISVRNARLCGGGDETFRGPVSTELAVAELGRVALSVLVLSVDHSRDVVAGLRKWDAGNGELAVVRARLRQPVIDVGFAGVVRGQREQLVAPVFIEQVAQV